ncbi:MAG: universal stress protein [Planctomycetes bacterium]|nr:universal stress protein [Planctomycetota bacterium]
MARSPKIIVAVDGSKIASQAAKFAVKEAQCQGAKIYLVHVVDWSGFEHITVSEMSERHAQREREIESAQKKILDPLVKKISAPGLEIESMVRHGHAVEVLSELAEELKATQIVVGRRGLGRLASLLLGSVSAGLAQVSPVPVTIVP